MSFFAKISPLTDLTRSNVDLGLKKYVQSRDLIETRRLVFFAKLYDHQGPIARGGGRTNPPPSTGEGGEIRKTGEG